MIYSESSTTVESQAAARVVLNSAWLGQGSVPTNHEKCSRKADLTFNIVADKKRVKTIVKRKYKGHSILD